jgi:hypothetical protein
MGRWSLFAVNRLEKAEHHTTCLPCAAREHEIVDLFSPCL